MDKMLADLAARGYRVVREAKLNMREYPELAFEVPCLKGRGWGRRRAHIYVHSEAQGLYGFSGVGTRLCKSLLNLRGVKAHQVGDEEFAVLFGPECFAAVAELVRPQKKRSNRG